MEKFEDLKADESYYSERKNLVLRILRSEEYKELLDVLPAEDDDFSEERDWQLLETVKESLLELYSYYKEKA